MIAALNILAKNEDLLHLIGVVALLLVAAVAAVIQRAAKKQQEKRAAEQKSEGRVDRPAQPPRRPPPAAEEMARAMREVLGLEPEQVQARQQPRPRPRPAAARPKPTPQKLQPARETEVHQLLRPGEPTLDRLRTDVGRERRIAPPLAAMPSGQRRDQPALMAALDDVQQARLAIVYHEIFSPPKALREGREMWDL